MINTTENSKKAQSQIVKSRNLLVNSSSNQKTLSVIIPAYNEADVIVSVLEELDIVLEALLLNCTIVVVDDGSHDLTCKHVLESRLNTPLKLVRLSRNFGKEIAMSAGLREACDSDAVVIMDADGQHSPELIIKFVNYWQQDMRIFMLYVGQEMVING